MDNPIMLALIAALPPTIAALAAWRTIGKKADAIHILVNSNMADMQQKLMSATGEIADLKRIVADLTRPTAPKRKRR